MRGETPLSAPLILGAGPAGSTAAILLARGGKAPVLLDRDANVGDPLCGGFMSWRTIASLRALGLDPVALGAHRVERLAMFSGRYQARVPLPEPAYGLSRHALDTALRKLAVEAGARLAIDRARRITPGVVEGEHTSWHSDAIFLATGKHDVRGSSRPREGEDQALGLRIRLPANAKLTETLAGTIELHFFAGGYAGIVLQEDGSANVCLALRKSLLREAQGDPHGLLAMMAERHPAFGVRMQSASSDLPIDTIGSVPYGWIAQSTSDGLYRLGDQAAVIPSLAGEGMGIALASGRAAAQAYLSGEDAESYQRSFARRARRPVAAASLVWGLAERQATGAIVTRLADKVPKLADLAMRISRIG